MFIESYNSEIMRAKLKYLYWAVRQWPVRDISCPFCKSQHTTFIDRKCLVTALYRCSSCKLMFRIPKETQEHSALFYQSEYSQGFTTSCPTDEALAMMKVNKFKETEKDYSVYISVLRAAGVLPGMKVFDFGCSWGYGSWQLGQADYQVMSWDVSRPRVNYAREKLGCKIVSPDQFDGVVDCLFSAHVLEHLDEPIILWKIACRILKAGGLAVLFVPNGEARNSNLKHWWGRVHPLLITRHSAKAMAATAGFDARTYSSPYDFREIAAGNDAQHTSGDELLIIARRTRTSGHA